MQWFAVDKRGLGKLIERKGKQFILYELVQNAWDEHVTHVEITLTKEPGSRSGVVTVRDDSPTGFADLSHAFTLFAESNKKGNAAQRGRFNLGEKMVLALCDEAQIASTKGTVIFNASGRRQSRAKTQAGSVFTASLKLTNDDVAEFADAARKLLPPAGIATTFNGEPVAQRKALATIEGVMLPTLIADDEGVLRKVNRSTTVEIVEPAPGETATLYELGIPVVETDGRWHINIHQKVPLNMDRDNVTPAYLGQVRALVAEHMREHLTVDDANSTWVRDAIERHGDDMEADTVERFVGLRFGDKRVSYDPSDPEANARATAAGYTVVHGSQMSKQEWSAVRRVGAILPAGQVTPSPKPFSPDGEPLKLLDPAHYTPAIAGFVEYAKRIGRELLGLPINVTVANDPHWGFNGCYGKGGSLTVNVGSFGYKWFEGELAPINAFLIHEFGHEYSGNHLSAEYYDALCRLGGKLTQLALDRPDLFRQH